MLISSQYDSTTGYGRNFYVNADMQNKKITFSVTIHGPKIYVQHEYSDFAEACEQYNMLWAAVLAAA